MGKYVIWILAALLLLTVSSLSGMAHSVSEAATPPAAEYEKLLRLHVVANSDSTEDQAVKRQVRDAVLDLLTPVLNEARTSKEARSLVLARQEEIRRVAARVLSLAGKGYGVQVEVGRFAFPTKVYGDVALPAGTYDALRISLGAAEGQNWWCVLFPPLCLVDAAGGVAVAPAYLAGEPQAADALVWEDEELQAQLEEAPVQVRYAFLEWLKRHPMSQQLRVWLTVRGLGAMLPAAE